MRTYITLVLFILILPLYPSMASDMRIAVMDFRADGVSGATARRVSELIRTEMINTGRFTVIERKQMDLVLREQGFQQTGCTDEGCAVEVGRLVSAEKILIGTVMKLGETIIINGRIVDVEKGVAEIGAREESLDMGGLAAASVAFTRSLTDRLDGGTATYEKKSVVKQENAKTNKYGFSPIGAAFISLLPVWSGAIGTDNTIWGIGFVGLKIASLGLSIKYGIDYNDAKDKYDRLKSEGYDPYGDTLFDAETDRDMKLIVFSFFVSTYVIATITDVFFSYFSVEGDYDVFVNRQGRPVREGTLALDVVPRFGRLESTTTYMREPEGFDVVLTRHF